MCCLRIILFIWICLAVESSWAAERSAPQKHQILILHSYSTDYQWTNKLSAGILGQLEKIDSRYNVRVEFMDTKNLYSPDYIQQLVQLYQFKYQTSQFDGLILTDNNALEFYQRYGHLIFPNVKAVATGINFARPPEVKSKVRSVIAELAEHKETIDQALKVLPDARRLYVLSDDTVTGKLIKKEVQDVLERQSYPLSVEYVDGLNLETLSDFVKGLSRNDIVYLLPYFRAKDGTTYPQGLVAQAISKASSAPIFVSWSFQLGSGVLGGHVISARSMGEQAALSLVRLLEGKHVELFQTHLPVSKSVFDYRVLQRFELSEPLFPRNSHFLYRTESYFDTHRSVIIPGVGIILTLMLITVLLILNLTKQKALNRNNERLMQLDKEVIDTQKELVATLGGVIEVRSQETHNHVIRVAKISRFIGELVELSDHELEMLETASPLHDVGKIGLPESILNKPGPLTPSELEVMKSHTQIGYDILNNSRRELLVVARDIALQHHESWDGSGYPSGLKGEEISIYARITTLADIYDALSSERCYKEPWQEASVLVHIEEQKGKIFDPVLADAFLQHFDEIRHIRDMYL